MGGGGGGGRDTPLYMPYGYVLPIGYGFCAVLLCMVFEGTHERICHFNSK